MRYHEILNEQVSVMHIASGWSDFAGNKQMVELKVWSNPLRAEFHRAIHACFAMNGDPNLRGLAHAGKVYVWQADKATHDGILQAVGLYDPATGAFDYSDPAFCFFMVYGGRWAENDDNPIIVSYHGNLATLQATVAKRWGATFHNGGPFMAA
jgi:hypothetical protein